MSSLMYSTLYALRQLDNPEKIAPARRRTGITLGHYSVIATFEPQEQEKYLDQVIAHKLTVSSLKEIVAEDHPKTKRGQKRKIVSTMAISSHD